MRFAHFVLWILFFLSGAAGAADNPLGAGRPDAVNPLGAPADPLAGNYVGDTFSLSLKNDGGGKYGGVIRMGAKEFPVTASGNGRR